MRSNTLTRVSNNPGAVQIHESRHRNMDASHIEFEPLSEGLSRGIADVIILLRNSSEEAGLQAGRVAVDHPF